MKVRLEKNLVDYMHDHEKDTIMLKLVHDDYSGYDINSKHPRIRYHKPRHPEQYDQFTVDDITIYVEKGIQTVEDELLFVDEKMIGVHRCHVIGVDLDAAKTFMNTFGPD